jgi:hypothetical protein
MQMTASVSNVARVALIDSGNVAVPSTRKEGPACPACSPWTIQEGCDATRGTDKNPMGSTELA